MYIALLSAAVLSKKYSVTLKLLAVVLTVFPLYLLLLEARNDNSLEYQKYIEIVKIIEFQAIMKIRLHIMRVHISANFAIFAPLRTSWRFYEAGNY